MLHDDQAEQHGEDDRRPGSGRRRRCRPTCPAGRPSTDESMWLPSALLVKIGSYWAHALASLRGMRTFDTSRLDSGSSGRRHQVGLAVGDEPAVVGVAVVDVHHRPRQRALAHLQHLEAGHRGVAGHDLAHELAGRPGAARCSPAGIVVGGGGGRRRRRRRRRVGLLLGAGGRGRHRAASERRPWRRARRAGGAATTVGYSPLKTGVRFSTKAAMASGVSLVEKFTVWAAPSSSRACSSVTWNALLSSRLVWARATGGPSVRRGGPVVDEGVELARRHDPVDEAEGLGLLGRQDVGEQRHLLGPVHAR